MNKINISEIKIPTDRRSLNKNNVDFLMQSIENIGLLNPIIVDKENNLIAGLHRLVACRQLKWTEIPASVVDLEESKKDLPAIDENIVRANMTVLDRCDQLYKRKKIFQELHPESKQGGDHKSAKRKKIDPFVKQIADLTGWSSSKVKQEIAIGENICDEAKKKLQATPLANKKGYLDKLAQIGHEEQIDELNKLEKEEKNEQ